MAERSTSTPPSMITRWLVDRRAVSTSSSSVFDEMASRRLFSIAGRRLSASSSVNRLAMMKGQPSSGALDARHLNRHRAAARAVKLGQNDALPCAQQHGGVAYLQTETLAHQHAAQVRIGVLALTIGELRVVMPPPVLAADHLLEE